MGLPLVLTEALGNQAVRQIVVGVGTGLAGGVLTSTFDKTSREICACLGMIDRTLISGFAGLGIKIDQLPGPLAPAGRLTRPGVNPDDFISTAGKRRAEEEAARDTRTRAQRRADALALGRSMIGEGQLPGATGSAANAPAGPTTIADQLKSFGRTEIAVVS